MPEPVCCCGHVRDEHYRSGKCTIEECECVCFEADNCEEHTWEPDSDVCVVCGIHMDDVT